MNPAKRMFERSILMILIVLAMHPITMPFFSVETSSDSSSSSESFISYLEVPSFVVLVSYFWSNFSFKSSSLVSFSLGKLICKKSTDLSETSSSNSIYSKSSSDYKVALLSFEILFSTRMSAALLGSNCNLLFFSISFFL